MRINRLFKVFISLVIISCNISCDQISKEKVRDDIAKNEIINVIDDSFILTNVENTGAAMSLGANLAPEFKVVLLQLLPLLIMLGLFIYIIREEKISKLNLVAFSFIIGGGIGNIYDRILYNSVTDFMYLELGELHTGIFNMADVSVVVGTILILLSTILSEINKNQLKRACS